MLKRNEDSTIERRTLQPHEIVPFNPPATRASAYVGIALAEGDEYQHISGLQTIAYDPQLKRVSVSGLLPDGDDALRAGFDSGEKSFFELHSVVSRGACTCYLFAALVTEYNIQIDGKGPARFTASLLRTGPLDTATVRK